TPGNISAEALRRAAGAATAKMSGITDITVALPAESAAHLTAVAEGSVLGTYSFAGYKTTDESDDDVENLLLTFVTSIADANKRVLRSAGVARSNYVT